MIFCFCHFEPTCQKLCFYDQSCDFWPLWAPLSPFWRVPKLIKKEDNILFIFSFVTLRIGLLAENCVFMNKIMSWVELAIRTKPGNYQKSVPHPDIIKSPYVFEMLLSKYKDSYILVLSLRWIYQLTNKHRFLLFYGRPYLFWLAMVDKGHKAVPPLLPRNWAEYRINEQISLPQANMSCCCVCCLLMLLSSHGVFMGQALRTLGDVRGVWTVLSCGYYVSCLCIDMFKCK